MLHGKKKSIKTRFCFAQEIEASFVADESSTFYGLRHISIADAVGVGFMAPLVGDKLHEAVINGICKSGLLQTNILTHSLFLCTYGFTAASCQHSLKGESVSLWVPVCYGVQWHSGALGERVSLKCTARLVKCHCCFVRLSFGNCCFI